MGSQPRRVCVTLENRLESMDLGEEIARCVAGTAAFDEDEQHRISMAVRECVINAFKHGNCSDVRKKIEVDFTLLADRLVVAVRDEGKGFSLNQLPDPLADERLLATSGRGIFLMRCFMDDLRVVSGPDGGTVVTMTKRLPSNHKPTAAAETTKERQP